MLKLYTAYIKVMSGLFRYSLYTYNFSLLNFYSNIVNSVEVKDD